MTLGNMHRIFSRRLARPFFRGLSRFTGKVRRAYLCYLRPNAVEDALERRQGSCNNCGKCCEISFSCPFLKVYGSHSICRIYHLGRPSPCSAFPIDRSDLADVDYECSFSFLEEQKRPMTLLPEGLPVWNTQDSSIAESSNEAFTN